MTDTQEKHPKSILHELINTGTNISEPSSVLPSRDPEAFRNTKAISFTSMSAGREALLLLFSSAHSNKLGENV